MSTIELLFTGGAIGALITAIGAVLVVFLNRFFDRLNRKDDVENLKKRMEESEEERAFICYALSACLDGLIQLGANHDVPIVKDKLDKYLNKKAHRLEETK